MNQVIAISGPIGAGKSSLRMALENTLPNCVSVDIDHYQSITQRSLAFVQDWMQSGANPDAFPLPRLANDLRQLRSGFPINHPTNGQTVAPAEVILFETPFGRLHTETAQQIDILLWIETPLDVALARKLQQFVGEALHNSSPSGIREFHQWIFVYLQNYSTTIHSLMRMQQERIASRADVRVDGTLPINQLVLRAAEAVGHLNRQ